jgi:hypothetical protein
MPRSVRPAPIAARAGIVVVRVWLESRHDEELRARVTTTEFATNEQTETYAASVDEILAIVRRWVETFAESA